VLLNEAIGVGMVAAKVEPVVFERLREDVEALGGSKTTQTKPVIRPLEHSCRKAIISQN
jgi:hypothetical protein